MYLCVNGLQVFNILVGTVLENLGKFDDSLAKMSNNACFGDLNVSINVLSQPYMCGLFIYAILAYVRLTIKSYNIPGFIGSKQGPIIIGLDLVP